MRTTTKTKRDMDSQEDKDKGKSIEEENDKGNVATRRSQHDSQWPWLNKVNNVWQDVFNAVPSRTLLLGLVFYQFVC